VSILSRAALLLMGLTACPPAGGSAEGSAQRPAATCTKEGDNCEYSAGKIGLCTAKLDGCEGGPCLSCVSLH
jgi:hypothetical protein